MNCDHDFIEFVKTETARFDGERDETLYVTQTLSVACVHCGQIREISQEGIKIVKEGGVVKL